MSAKTKKYPVLPSSGGALAVLFEGQTEIPFSGNGRISYYCHTLDSDVTFPFMRSREFLGLHFNLQNDFNYAIHSDAAHDSTSPDDAGTILKNQYNLVHVPEGLYNFSIQKGAYASLSIEFTPEYLKVFAERFPVLQDFLNKTIEGTPVLLSKTHLTAPPEILRIIHDILNNEFTGAGREIYLNSKVFDILLSSLLHITDVNNPFDNPFTKTDIVKIRQARDIILEELHKYQSLSLLAHRTGMARRRLADGFKMLYGTTIYNFLIEERLKKAMALIRDTTIPLSKISSSVGYKRFTNFSGAFKKKYGYPPREFRKTDDHSSSQPKGKDKK